MIKPIVVGFYCIVHCCYSRLWMWYLTSEMSPGLSQDFMEGYINIFRLSPCYLNCGFPVGELSLSEFLIGGYDSGFLTMEAPVSIPRVANFLFSLCEI